MPFNLSLISGRADDNLEVIKRRFYSYEHETKEVLDKLKEQVIKHFCLTIISSTRLRKSALNLLLKKRTNLLLYMTSSFPNSIKAYTAIMKKNGLM